MEHACCHIMDDCFTRGLEFVIIGNCPNRNLSELEFVRIGMSELEFVKIGNYLNWGQKCC